MKYAYIVVAVIWTVVVTVVLFDGGYRQARVIIGGSTTCFALWRFVVRYYRTHPSPSAAPVGD